MFSELVRLVLGYPPAGFEFVEYVIAAYLFIIMVSAIISMFRFTSNFFKSM